VLNALRIVVLVIIGSHGHQEIATQGFHYHAGTLVFGSAARGLGAWASASRIFGTTAGSAPTVDGVRDGTAAHVLPFVVLLLTALVTGAASRDGFDTWYGARLLTTAAVLWMMRGRLAGGGGGGSWGGGVFGGGGSRV